MLQYRSIVCICVCVCVCVCVCLASLKWNDGACSGTVYSGDEKLTKLMAKVASIFLFILTVFNMMGLYHIFIFEDDT